MWPACWYGCIESSPAAQFSRRPAAAKESVYSAILRPASDGKVHGAPTESSNSLVLRMLSVEMVTIWV